MNDIPVLTLIDDSEVQKEPVLERLPSSVGQDGHGTHSTKKEKSVAYFTQHHIPQKMDLLTTQLLAQRPDNPISFCVALLKLEDMGPDGRPVGPSRIADEELKARITAPGAREYILAHKLPWLFDDLLSGLAIEKPIDPHAWALQWLKIRRMRTGVPLDEKADYLDGVSLV
jgi:hypothetical protein